jgi:hypothetical protein
MSQIQLGLHRIHSFLPCFPLLDLFFLFESFFVQSVVQYRFWQRRAFPPTCAFACSCFGSVEAERYHLALLVYLPWPHQHWYVLHDSCHVCQHRRCPLHTVFWPTWIPGLQNQKDCQNNMKYYKLYSLKPVSGGSGNRGGRGNRISLHKLGEAASVRNACDPRSVRTRSST